MKIKMMIFCYKIWLFIDIKNQNKIIDFYAFLWTQKNVSNKPIIINRLITVETI